MSITVVDAPIGNSSVHDDLWHVAESTNSNQVDFKYVFDLYVNNVQLIRAKIYPNPADTLGYFNVSNIISNEMKFDWFVPDGNVFMKELNDSGEIYLSYDYKIGEDVAGVTTLNMASGTIRVANCTPNLYARRFSESSILDDATKKFLTNRDKLNLKSKSGEDLYIGGCLIPFNSSLEVYQYNSSGTQIDDYNIAIPNGETSSIYQMNISPDALTELGVTFLASCSYYEVEMWNRLVNPDVFLDKVRVYFDCNPKYEVINLHFMNNYGLFDTARFQCVSKLSMDVERKKYEKPDYRFNNGVKYSDTVSVVYGGSNYKYYESKINYGSQYQWTYKLTMDFPNDVEYKWLAELLMSPQIWAEIRYDNGYNNNEKEYYPVSVKATNYEYSKHINNGLRAFEVEIDMNQKRNGFRR